MTDIKDGFFFLVCVYVCVFMPNDRGEGIQFYFS